MGESDVVHVDARALERRLRKEGRWEEAKTYRNVYLKFLDPKSKLPVAERLALGWDEVARAFTPGSTEPVELPTGKKKTSGAGRSSRPLTTAAVQIEIPSEWGRLPDKAPYRSEIQWVHSNLPLVLEHRSSGADIVWLDRALGPMPAISTVNILREAIANPAKFGEKVGKVLGGLDSGDDKEAVKRERHSIEAIRESLERFQEAT